MDPRKEAAEIMRTRTPPRRRRAPHGQWTEPAKTVAILMDSGKWNISDAVREMIERNKFVTAKPGSEEAKRQFRQAFDGIRAAYYMSEKRKGREAKQRKGREAKQEFEL